MEGYGGHEMDFMNAHRLIVNDDHVINLKWSHYEMSQRKWKGNEGH